MARNARDSSADEGSAVPDDPITQFRQAAARLAHLTETLRIHSAAVEGLVQCADEYPIPRDELIRIMRPSLETLRRLAEEMDGALLTLRTLGEAGSRRHAA